MIKSLTARERFMLRFLAVFITASACLYLIVMPTLSRTAQLAGDVEITRQTALELSAVITGGDYDARTAQVLSQTEGMNGRLLPYMTNSELDGLITGELLAAGLSPVRLALGSAERRAVPAAGFARGEPPMLTQNTADAVFTGSLDAFSRFLSAIDGIDGARLTYAGYGKPEGGGYTFTVSIVFYMREAGHGQ